MPTINTSEKEIKRIFEREYDRMRAKMLYKKSFEIGFHTGHLKMKYLVLPDQLKKERKEMKEALERYNERNRHYDQSI